MSWVRLLEIVDLAKARTGREPKVDGGWNWQCYCLVCSALRKLVL